MSVGMGWGFRVWSFLLRIGIVFALVVFPGGAPSREIQMRRASCLRECKGCFLVKESKEIWRSMTISPRALETRR